MRTELIQATTQFMIENFNNPNLCEMVVNFVLDYKKVKVSKTKIGHAFGEWTIEANAGMRGTHKYYLCRCSCGQTKEVADSNLSSGKSKSCGQCGKSKIEEISVEKKIIYSTAEILDYHNNLMIANNMPIVNKYGEEII